MYSLEDYTITIPKSYENDEEAIINYLIDLKKYILCNDTSHLRCEDVDDIDKIIMDMDYCCKCGCKLKLEEWSEPHTELDGNPLEYFSELYCPNCDV